MKVRLSLSLLAGSLLVAGCAEATPPTAAPSPTDPTTSDGVRIEVRLTDEMRIEPAEMTVPAGPPVTFVVTNVGVIDHEFFVGDEEAQQEHEQEMMAGGMRHDEEMGITVAPGDTKELTLTFPEAGTTLAGCHEPGHYAAGMKATIAIGP